MSTIDIVARLQLRAEQFSSETGAKFAEMKTRAASSATEIRKEFSGAFAEVQRLTNTALTMPAVAGGGIDLSGEIAALNVSAAAADRKADVMRQLADASFAAASAAGVDRQAMLLEADAASIGALAAERAAQADRDRVVALQAVQHELDRIAPATGVVGGAMKKTTEASGAMRSAMQGVSYSAQDLITQVSMGTNVLSALSIQGMQAAGAFAHVEGAAGKFGNFMMGPWGLAIGAALLVAGKLTDGLFSQSEASKAAEKAAEAHRKAVDDLARAQEKAILTGERKQALDVAQIKIDLDAAIATRRRTQAELAAAEGNLQSAQRRIDEGGGVEAAGAAAMFQNQVSDIRARMSANSAEIAALERGVNAGFARMVEMRVDARSTPEGRTRSDYEREKARAMNDPALQGEANATRLAARLRELNEQRDRELKLIEQANRAARETGRTGGGRDVLPSTAVAKMLRDALPGVQITSTTGGKHVPNSYHYKNQAVDFVPAGGMGSMTKADVRKIFEKRGIDIVELLGPGDAGHSDHFHVAWTRGKNELANFSAEAKRTADAQKLVEQAQKDLVTSLTSLEGRYDPVTDAANRYRDALAEIARLEALPSANPAHLDRTRGDLMRAAALTENMKSTNPEYFTRIDDGGWLKAYTEKSRDEQEKAERAIKDSQDEIARHGEEVFHRLGDTFHDVFSLRTDGMFDGFKRQGIEAISALATKWVNSKIGVGALGSIQENMGYGAAGGSVFSSITGGKQSALGSTLGGALGGELGKMAGPAVGKALGSVVGPALGKSLGGMAGPIGAVAGGILGSVIGGLFKKKSPSGSVDITGTDAGSATASGKLGSALTGNASAVQKSLTQIAEQLGAVTGAFSVSIGKSGDWYHVAGTAGADVSAKHPKSPLIYEGKDEAAAVQAALLNALQDGAIKGISEAAQRILKSGQDLDAALNKALLIEAIPKDLKAALDPVGAAVDALNLKWKKTIAALEEGGASADQMAQAQQLFNLQMQQTKASTSSASQGLKDFLNSLKIGSNSPYSLRDQEAAAQAALKPFLDQIAGGQAIDQSKYQAAAQSYLDVERQLYGSTDKYFAALDAVQASTNAAISRIDNAVPITPGVPDPFTKATADSAAATADAVQTGNEIAVDTNAILQNISTLMAQVVANTGGGGAVDQRTFISASRNFLNAA